MTILRGKIKQRREIEDVVTVFEILDRVIANVQSIQGKILHKDGIWAETLRRWKKGVTWIPGPRGIPSRKNRKVNACLKFLRKSTEPGIIRIIWVREIVVGDDVREKTGADQSLKGKTLIFLCVRQEATKPFPSIGMIWNDLHLQNHAGWWNESRLKMLNPSLPKCQKTSWG